MLCWHVCQLSMHAMQHTMPCMTYQVCMSTSLPSAKLLSASAQVYCILCICCVCSCLCMAVLLPIMQFCIEYAQYEQQDWVWHDIYCATSWCRVTTEGDQRGHCTPPMYRLHPPPPYPPLSAPPCRGMQVCKLLMCSGLLRTARWSCFLMTAFSAL